MMLLTEAKMHELTQIVAPSILNQWEELAYCMRYEPGEVKAIRKDSQDLKECCKKLFLDWLTTNHGPIPKTYQTLLNNIKQINDLGAASDKIEKDLIKGKDQHCQKDNVI